MQDILLKKNSDSFYDIDFENGDFKSTDGLDTAIIMSLLTDARATSSEVPEPSRRRGWIGNEQNDDPDYQIGSKLWLLDQSLSTQSTANSSEGYSSESLQWLVNDQLVQNITADSQTEFENILINIKFTRFDNSVLSKQFELWENTELV